MLNIKTIKKLLMLAVALVMLFTAAFFCCNTNLTALAQGEPTAEEVDDYLRDNGYSEEFIEMVGPQTKLVLYQNGASLQNTISVPVNGGIELANENTDPGFGDDNPGFGYNTISGDWEGFEAHLWVSDISDESIKSSKKMLTMAWNWSTGDLMEMDAVGFAWDSMYQFLEDSALFEVSGNAYKVAEYLPNPAIGSLPVAVQADFPELTKTGYDAFTYAEDELTQENLYTKRQSGVGYQFDVDFSSTVRRFFGSGSYADYQLNPAETSCTYSVMIQNHIELDENKSLVINANYFHWTTQFDFWFDVTFDFTISYPPVVSISIDPEFNITEQHEKSSNLPVSVNNYNRDKSPI